VKLTARRSYLLFIVFARENLLTAESARCDSHFSIFYFFSFNDDDDDDHDGNNDNANGINDGDDVNDNSHPKAMTPMKSTRLQRTDCKVDLSNGDVLENCP